MPPWLYGVRLSKYAPSTKTGFYLTLGELKRSRPLLQVRIPQYRQSTLGHKTECKLGGISVEAAFLPPKKRRKTIYIYILYGIQRDIHIKAIRPIRTDRPLFHDRRKFFSFTDGVNHNFRDIVLY